MDNQFDLIVLGGGPGGYVAAIRAAQLGMKTAIVERENLGGICLNWGCIPTKALLRSSEINHLLHHLDEFGFAADNVRFDLQKVVKRSRGVAKQLSSGVAHLMKKNKITRLHRQRQTRRQEHPRSHPDRQARRKTHRPPHHPRHRRPRPRTPRPGIRPQADLDLPRRHGPEQHAEIPLGDRLRRHRHRVRQLLPQHGRRGDCRGSHGPHSSPSKTRKSPRFARKAFEKQGIEILTNAKVTQAKKNTDSVTCTIEVAGKTLEKTADRVISAIGIVGNVEDLGLDGTGVKVDRTHIVIDEFCRTGEPGVYAIGDITGAPWLAHKASHEGVICVESIARQNDVHPLDVSNIPGCTYSRPQIASVGLTEAKAKAAGHKIRVGRFPFIGNGKAIAMGEPEGLVKTIFDETTGELLGAHMIGAEVTEMIQGYTIARTLETTETDLMHTVFPHPTVSETMHEAVLSAYGRAIHF